MRCGRRMLLQTLQTLSAASARVRSVSPEPPLGGRRFCWRRRRVSAGSVAALPERRHALLLAVGACEGAVRVVRNVFGGAGGSWLLDGDGSAGAEQVCPLLAPPARRHGGGVGAMRAVYTG
eukprot:583343-Rhodomonas_salina.1